MLNVLRSSIKGSPYLKGILIAVGIGLIAYLGSYFVGDQGAAARADWVARVNGADIPEWRFREVARDLDQRYRDLFGANYEQIRPQLQIRRQALEGLIDKQLILQDARRLGLHSSAADLADQIRNHPGLRDADGQFIGTERYKRVLERNYRGGFAAFERNMAEDLLESQWTALVTQPVRIENDELRELFRARTEKTEIEYVLLASADQKIDGDVGDDELRQWYDENLDDYMRDAGRSIRYVLVDRASLMDSIEVLDDEIRSYYEGNQAAYAHPDQRRARHILFRLAPGATDEDKQRVRQRGEAALTRLRAGEAFDAVAQELSEDVVSAQRGGDLDFFARDQMVEPFADAAFNTEVGEYAPLTETPYGIHVIEVTDARPAGTAPLEDVEDDIRRLLRVRQVDDRLSAEAQQLRDAIGSADRLDEIAARDGLTVESTFFSQSAGIPELRATPEFDATVAALETGVLSAPLPVATGMAIVVVDAVLPPSAAPFEEVEESVTATILEERRQTAALTAAQEAYERHGDFAAVARALRQEVKQSGALAPGQVPPDVGGATPELKTRLFDADVSEGDDGVIAVPAGALVYRIAGREPFDPQRFESERDNLRREALENRRAQYRQGLLRQMRTQQQIEYNPAWLDSLES